jgi:chaperonin cofactor prefoldin
MLFEQNNKMVKAIPEKFIMSLVNAIKELKTQNEDLKSRIEVLENS